MAFSHTPSRVTAWLIAATIVSSPALADENGVPTAEGFSCADNAVSSIITVCKAVKEFLPTIECPTHSSTCVKASQEIFTGVTGEPASPTNIKPWNGQGGGGELYQSVGLCLLRDLAVTPMRSKAEASLPIGNISASGLVNYTSFDKVNKKFSGYHRLTAHAPVIGDVEIMTQPFSARSVASNLIGQNKKVGEYSLFGAQALEFETEGGIEDFGFELDAITIVTPYGVVSPKPHLSFARTSGWSLSPYGGASKMLLNPGALQMTDVYGRLAGQAVASSLEVTEFKAGTYPGAKFCQNFAASPACLWPKPTGWDSQLLLGSRNVDPTAPSWNAPPGVEFPARPDADTAAARGNIEKMPGAFATAGIKVNYSPTDLIPAVIRNNGFISIDFSVFADPNISVGYASQFNFWNGRGAAWNPLLTPPQPANVAPVVATPVDVESLHTMGIYGGSSVAGRFAIDAGVDLTLHVHISLPWPLDDIDFNILNVHPRTALLETISADNDRSPQQALVISDWQHFVRTAQIFKVFTPFNGGATDGIAFIQKCFADPPPAKKDPPKPKYTPGDPEDLVETLDMPCNICVGHADFTYIDVKSKSPLSFEPKQIKGHVEKVPFVDDSSLAPSDRWTCGGPLPAPTNFAFAGPDLNPANVSTKEDAKKFNLAAAEIAKNGFKNVGCYDQCRVNKTTGKFELIASAKTLFAQGALKDVPHGCH